MRTRSGAAAFLALLMAASPAGQAADEAGAPTVGLSQGLFVEVMAADRLAGSGEILFAGNFGLLGLATVGEDGGLRARLLESGLEDDLIAVAALDAGGALVGSGAGRVHRFENGALGPPVEIGEYRVPVIDIETQGGVAWVVGARGLAARSADGGASWTPIELGRVRNPELTLDTTEPGLWYTGVANVVPETVELRANVGGRPAVADEHYVFSPDEGTLEILAALDADPVPTLRFEFVPGPPFQHHDVSWNVVLLSGQEVTLAGEFGLIVHSADGGRTWERLFAKLSRSEPEQPYWIAGDRRGDTLALVGAAGVAVRSSDGGRTWSPVESPSDESLFGVRVAEDGSLLVAGAVGLAGRLPVGASEWSLVDRTRLGLFSWMKTFVPLEDGSLLLLGGRRKVIRHQPPDGWTPVDLELESGRS